MNRYCGLLGPQNGSDLPSALGIVIIHSPRNKNQDLGAAESRYIILFWDGDTMGYDGMKNNEGIYLLTEILTDDK